jgi:thiosulfate/3-mercaptopyruvate sulfurtransferase
MPSPLITADEFARLIGDDGQPPTILDVRWELATGADREAYLEGHVPGAAFVDLDRQLADPPSEGGRHPLPGTEGFTAEMRALGVSARRPVVVYDAATSTAAARAWWLLRYFGHPDVRVLDGGLAAWIATGHPLSTEPAVPRPGDFIAQPGAMPTVSAAGAQSLAARGVLLDARTHERFLGLVEPIDPVAGHIPGARNRPTTENLTPDGRFLDPVSLRTAFGRLGVREDLPVAAYCGSGVTAAHEVLALELAGYHAALYPGSWSEWIGDARRPVATGEEPGSPQGLARKPGDRAGKP